jgi:hypothetical protein
MTARWTRQTLLAATILAGSCFWLAPDVLAQAGAPQPVASAPVAAPDGWPRDYRSTDATLTVYQPQIDSWTGNKLVARAAVQVVKPSNPNPSFGVIWFSARTDVDKSTRLVTLQDIKVDKGSFPAEPNNEADYLSVVRQGLPPGGTTMSLDRLQANMAVTEGQGPQGTVTQVKNDVPRILIATDPAALVLIDGQPALRATSDASLLRIVNSRALILFNQGAGRYYLRIMGRWASAQSLDGAWTTTKSVPAAADQIRKGLGQGYDPMTGPLSEADAARQALPKVSVSTGPAELIQISGKPQYQPIPGTQLLTVSNTASDLILNLADNQHYVLISGRWFRGPGLDGPWTYVSNDALPPDFARIPEAHPRGAVLPAVSGTPQAKEAVIAAQVPQTATVVKSQVSFKATYDSGKPIWGPIDGTSMQYAANTPNPVIKVSEASYFAVSNGVWFTSTSAFGPWAPATLVPPVIYTIPPASPVYYVTGVHVYGGTTDFVYVGYTPAYMGTVVAPTGTVVFGTGYVYQPYIAPVAAVYYPPPATYGYGAGFATGMVTGLTFGFVAGSLMSHPWGGAYPCCGWGWGGGGNNVTINNVNNVYNRWGNNTVLKNDQQFNNYLNNHPQVNQQYQRDQNRDVRQVNRDLAKNPQAQARAQQYGDNHPQAQARANNAEAQQRQDRQQAIANGRADTQNRANDVYGGQDGNVYRRSDDNQGWDRQGQNGNWSRADTSATTQRLDQERQGRQLGNTQYNAFRQSPHAEAGGGGRFRR